MNLREIHSRLGFMPADPEPRGAKAPAGSVDVRDDSESAIQNVYLPLGGGAPALAYGTSRQWDSIDVWIQFPQLAPGEFVIAGHNLGVRVWAVTRGVRVLAASGRVGGSQVSAALPLWIASFRGVAERFEVDVITNFQVPSDAYVTVAVVATNGAPDAPAFVGASPLSQDGKLTDQGIAVPALALVDSYELSAVQAVSKDSPRWLHVHDLQTVVSAVGVKPLFAVPIGPSVPMFLDVSAALRAKRFVNGIVLAGSTTHDVTTLPLAGSVSLGGLYK